MRKTLLFRFGCEGGDAEVYQLPDNRVLEKGTSGGMLDEDEDPVRAWEKFYVNFEGWWNHFTLQHGDNWAYVYPIFIHESVKPMIRSSLERYLSFNGQESERMIERWKEYLY